MLVTIDTLRADRLGCYGNKSVATPVMDRLAAEGALAEDASVHVPLTRPSHVTLFTGRYPAEHGIRDNVSPTLADSFVTLPQVLKGAGFSTAGFVSSIVVSAQSGLNRGFDTYSDRFDIGDDDARFLNTIQKDGGETVTEAVAWLRAHARARTATWVHLYEPHDPYEPPEPYATQYAGRPYDGEVAWSDALVGRLDAALAELRIRDDTLIVVTSDHGEGLGEHDESVHGFFVYETTLRVPLIVRGPGIAAGTRVRATARSVDLLPTILEMLGIATPADLPLSGRSLAAGFRATATVADASTYAESLIPLVHYGWSDLRTLRDGRWKYILAPRPELYDLQQDPGETRNLADAQQTRARALRSALEARLKEEQKMVRATPAAQTVPPDLLEKLGALGYVSPGAPSQGASSAGADPKDKILEYKLLNRLMREGLTNLREQKYAASVERMNALRARGIDSFEVNYYLGRALVGVGRYRDAAGYFTRAIERLPAFGPAYVALADARLRLNDAQGAIEALRRGQAVSPKDTRLYRQESAIWKSLKRRPEAIRALETMAALTPRDALARVELGELYRDEGQLPRAIALLQEAVKLDPAIASYWNSLGMVLGGAGDMPAAEAAFREASTRDRSHAQYAYNLGLAILRQGRQAEAAVHFREALKADPGFGAARAQLQQLGTR